MRTPEEREGDLAAQIGACRVGERRILEIVEQYGLERVNGLTEELLDYSERLMRAELRKHARRARSRLRTFWTTTG